MSNTNTDVAIKSCLADSPLNPANNTDILNSGDYATALYNFIINADTPVTLGIQGGWGSGKTSLFYLLEEKLNADNHKAITIRINAWEHSLFQEGEGRGLIVLSVLGSLIKSISGIASSEWIDEENRLVLQPKDKGHGLTKKLMNAGSQVLSLAGNLAIQSFIPGAAIFNNLLLKQNKKDQTTEEEKTREDSIAELPILAEQIHSLKEQLERFIENIKHNKQQSRVVIFIDDLDRVPPPIAVEILDVIKNIFDIKNCIFVLAIDYEVIVKGLETKFGERSNKNEREFRQYFDKIIQIPFTMPIGAFSARINNMLKESLSHLNYRFDQENEERTIKKLATAVKLATGGLPRSIKRVLNTFSLLDYIAQQKSLRENDVLDKFVKTLPLSGKEAAMLEARFIIVALHINFPELFKRVMEKPNFLSWNPEELKTPWDLDIDDNITKLEAFANGRYHDYFDDPWEEVIFYLSQKIDWLKNNVVNLSGLFNLLLEALKNAASKDSSEDEDEVFEEDTIENIESLSRDELNILNNLLESMKVISIDNELLNMEIDNSEMIKEDWRKFCMTVWSKIKDNINLDTEKEPCQIKVELNEDKYIWKVPIKGLVKEFYLQWDNTNKDIYYSWSASRSGMNKNDSTDIANDHRGDFSVDLIGYGTNRIIELYAIQQYDDISNCISQENIDEISEQAISQYKRIYKISKKMEKEMR